LILEELSIAAFNQFKRVQREKSSSAEGTLARVTDEESALAPWIQFVLGRVPLDDGEASKSAQMGEIRRTPIM
jgi:hypothetical protein